MVLVQWSRVFSNSLLIAEISAPKLLLQFAMKELARIPLCQQRVICYSTAMQELLISSYSGEQRVFFVQLCLGYFSFNQSNSVWLPVLW